MENPQFVNFCRLANILLETSAKVLSKRLEVCCNIKHLSFEQFLTKIRHDVFHMSQPTRCCQCDTTPLPSSRKIFRQQFEKLYCSIRPPIPDHVKKQSQVCACHIVPTSGISPSDIDISLSSFILLNFCDLPRGDQTTVTKLRELRNEHIAHSPKARISDEDFNKLFVDAEIEILAVAKRIDQAFFHEIRSELAAIKSKEINENIGEEQMKIVKQYYVSSKCLFEILFILHQIRLVSETGQEVYEVFEMLRRKSRDIPEKLEHIKKIVEPIHKDVAEDMRQISALLRQPLFHEKSKIKQHLSLWLRKLHRLFPDSGLMDTNNDSDDDKDLTQDVQLLHNCSVRENNMLCTKNEIDIHKSGIYIPVRAVREAEKKLNTNGIITFIGKTGSGKSTHSLELLHQASNGKIFKEPHDIIHLSQVDDWEHLILPSKNTLVYIEDPLGRTSANVSLIQNDGGIFQKIWACVQKGKIKIIMSIRSNIINEYSEDLQRYKLFNPEHLIDLSSGKFKLNNTERKELISLYCDFYQVKIVDKKSEENIHSKEALKQHKVKIAKSTIQAILKKDPAIGFPLCLKNFLGNKRNTCLGLDYFSIPTQTQLLEIENLAKSKHSVDRCQFAILVLVLFKGGRLNESSISSDILKEIGKDFDMTFIHKTMVMNALKNLKNKSILHFKVDEKCYKYSHDTILEAVFNVYTTLVPNKIDLLIKKADIRIIYEMIRTSNNHKNPQDSLLVLDSETELLLVERFISELRENNIKDVILHPALTDEQFRKKFFHELKKEENRNLIESQNGNENSIFMLSCLFNKYSMVQFILDITDISPTCVSDSFQLCDTLDNFETISLLLPFLSQQEIAENFISSCRTGKVEIVKIFFQNQSKIAKEVVKKAFHILCLKGRTDLVKCLLCNNPKMCNELIKYGFSAACQNDNVSTVEVLLNEVKNLTDEEIEEWLTCLSLTSVGQPFLKKLFTSHSSISSEFASIIFHNLCLKLNIQGVKWLLKENCLSDNTLVKVLLTICANKELVSATDVHISRYELNTDGIKCRSKSMETFKNRHVTEKKISRQRSVSDSDSTIETSSDCNQPTLNFRENVLPPASLNDDALAKVTGLVLSERKSIKTHHLRDFILKVFEHGKKRCFQSVLKERSVVSEMDIVDGIRLAVKGHHMDIIELVLQRGTLSPASINIILNDACNGGNTAVVESILAKHDISQTTVIENLQQAVQEKNIRTVQTILQIQLYLPPRVLSQLLTYVCQKDDHILLKIILDHRKKDIPYFNVRLCFIRACQDNFLNIVEQLLVEINNGAIFQGLLAACRCNKSDTVKLLLSRGIHFPETTLQESLKVACLNYSLETIATISKFAILSKRSVNQVGIVCLHTRPSLFETVIKLFIQNVLSFIEETLYGSSQHSLYDSSLSATLINLWDSFSASDLTTEAFYHMSLYILVLYGDEPTIKTVYNNSFYMSDWMISEILKIACKKDRHEFVKTILDIADDLPVDCLQQGLEQAFKNKSSKCLKCILGSKQDIPEWYLEVYFIDACRNSDTDCVATVLNSRKTLRTEFIEQGLRVAVVHQKYDIAEILLNQRFDIPLRCFVDLFKTACVNSDSSIIALLLRFNQRSDNSILNQCFLESCVFNLTSNVQMILQWSNVRHDVLVQGFESACRWNNVDTIHKILEIQNTNFEAREIKNQLYILCYTGKAKTILTILKSRQNLTSYVYRKCCELGRLKIVKSLLKTATLKEEEINDGITTAKRCHQIQIVKHVLQKSVLQENYIGQHLEEACQGGENDLVEYILRRRHNLSTAIIEGCVSIACKERQFEVIRVMLYHCADMEIVQKELLLACRKDDLDVFNVILENAFLNNSVQTKIIQEAFNIGSPNAVFRILIKCHNLTPRNIYEGITWLDAINKPRNLTLRVCDEINMKCLVSVLKYACSQTNIRVIEIILSSNRMITQEHLRQIISKACNKNNLVAFEAILKLQPQLADKHLLQILMKAIEQCNILIVDILLKYKKGLFINNESFLWQKAVISGENGVLKIILKNKGSVSIENVAFALNIAFCNRNVEMFKTILQASPDVVDKQIMRFIFTAFKHRDHNFVNSVLCSRSKFSKRQFAHMLVKAANQGKQDIVNTILQIKPDIKEDDILNLNDINKSTKRKTVRMLKSTLAAERTKGISRFLLLILMFILWIVPGIEGHKTASPVTRRRKKKKRGKPKIIVRTRTKIDYKSFH